MTNQQPTTHTTEAPEQPTLPGNEPKAETRPVGKVSDADDLAAENAQLKTELHIRSAVYDVETRLAKAGARSPNLMATSVKERFQLDEEGTLTNAEAVIDHLMLTYPEQFAADPIPSIDASAGRTPRPTLTKEALARMTPEEINRLDWAEVRATLAS